MNALAGETSPYLLQHKDNPVDWLPWGEEALRRAKEEDKPILVSIGYSACHWCHVMERESFEDEQVARLMNERFVCVKVDREERPDVDALYMEAVQSMTGSGGWPLNCFLTPDQTPFYGGTYFPPRPAQNMPSWTQVLEALSKAWTEQRDEIEQQGRQMAGRLQGAAALRPSQRQLDPRDLDTAEVGLTRQFDQQWGGFGGAPKFPPSSVLDFLLGRGEPRMALMTLHAMRSGGINDQVGGGFSRYAVDRTWTVPHFEKMLYDNALLARAYLHGFQTTQDPRLRATCAETLTWMAREMRAPEGGFFSAFDADSEGVEGRFYVWTLKGLRASLDPADVDAAIAYFGVTEEGNFEGANVLEGRGPVPDDATLARIRARLLEVRSARTRPGLDDKRLTAWNALAISAFAEAGAVLERPDWLDVARGAADFVLTRMRTADGRLLRTFNGGEAKLNAYLEDHAYLLEALLALYEATFEPRWFAEARTLADTLLARFADTEHGGFFTTSDDHEQLVARRKDLEDHPIPSAGSSAALGLLRLGALTGERTYTEAAEGHLRLVHELAPQHPHAFGHLLQALTFHTRPVREIALVGDPAGVAELARVVRSKYRPNVVLAGGDGSDDGGVPLLEGRTPVDGRAAAYVCEGFACRQPVTTGQELEAVIG
ncbi:MAG TPA: thioredoxin domain-containing protein [Solirubrobacteraceae bacterium]|nr:thioredoxin domain-containing protein [Solirubrobacteraceae bacterium]